MSAARAGLLPILLTLLAGCSPSGTEPAPSAAQTPAQQAAMPAGFANKVWKVRTSAAVETGMLYVFLSDGTLLITSRQTTPLLGSWRYRQGKLTMVEAGIAYSVDILKLGADEFIIRSHHPGGAVDIVLMPAD